MKPKGQDKASKFREPKPRTSHFCTKFPFLSSSSLQFLLSTVDMEQFCSAADDVSVSDDEEEDEKFYILLYLFVFSRVDRGVVTGF